MRFVSRAEWGARKPKSTSRIGSVKGVTLHWEGPRMGSFPHSQCDDRVRQIQRFHMDTRGWADIAYTGVVCPHGYVFEGRGVNVRSAANGTSGIGGNTSWYALCYLGGQNDGFTDEGKQAFKDGVDWLRRNGGAGGKVNGHRDHHATECPGEVIYRWLRNTNWTDLEEDDMPTAKEVSQAVWHAEEIPADPPNKDNPTWQPRNVLNLLIRQNKAIIKALDALVNDLTEETRVAVRQALTEATVQVDVNVAGGDERGA